MPPRHAYWTILVDSQPTAFRAHEADELLPTLNRLKEKHPSAVMMWFERGKLWESRDAARAEGLGEGERLPPGQKPWRDRPPRDEQGGDAPPAREARSDTGRPRDKNWRPGGEHKDPRQKYKDAKKAKWQRFKQNIRDRHTDRDEPRAARRDEPRPLPREREVPRDSDSPRERDIPRETPEHRPLPQADLPRSERRDAPRENWRPKSDSPRGEWRPKGPPRGRPPGGDGPSDRRRVAGSRSRGRPRRIGWRPSAKRLA